MQKRPCHILPIGQSWFSLNHNIVKMNSSFFTLTPFGGFLHLLLFQSLRLPPTNWKRAVTDWYDEVQNLAHLSRRVSSVFLLNSLSAIDIAQVRLFSRRDVKPFVFNSAIGHFSQLVWAETYKVTFLLIIVMMAIILIRSMGHNGQ